MGADGLFSNSETDALFIFLYRFCKDRKKRPSIGRSSAMPWVLHDSIAALNNWVMVALLIVAAGEKVAGQQVCRPSAVASEASCHDLQIHTNEAWWNPGEPATVNLGMILYFTT